MPHAWHGNVMALLLTAPMVVLSGICYAWRNLVAGNIAVSENILVWLALLFDLIVVHEGIRGLFWSFFVPNDWQDISFGMIWCWIAFAAGIEKVAVPVRCGNANRVLLGILPAIAAILVGNGMLFLLGAMMILGGGGDLARRWKLLTYRSDAQEQKYLDCPYAAGLVIFERRISFFKKRCWQRTVFILW